MTPKKFPIKKLAIAIIIVAAVAWVIYYFASPKKPAVNEVAAIRGSIVQTVSVTGNVQPADSVDLAFETTGKVVRVYVNVGDAVSTGQILAQLDTSELTANLAKAQADLATQKSDLDKARIVLANYYGNIGDTLNDAYTKSNDAVRTQTDLMFTDDDTNPKLTFSALNSQTQINLESQRLQLNKTLNDLLAEISQMNQSSTNDALENTLHDAKSKLMAVRNFLDLLSDAVSNAISLSASTITTYKTNLTAARTGVNTALTNITDLEQNISVQKATITSDEAGITSYEATAENIQAQINKALLYAPLDGVVTQMDAKVGEIAAANTTIVSIITASKLEVEANIPEADIAKVKIGDSAAVTLDAYSNDVVFDTKVTSIDPAETMIEGVATYKTKFQFIKNDGRPKSGMTANIDITTDKHENVIIIPQRAITAKTDGKFVLIDAGNPQKPEERTVKTGLRGPDGNVEITDGLREGEKVIIPTLE
jgi:multidrug efflux pump subunit AcrA (membrane-fusion protein)